MEGSSSDTAMPSPASSWRDPPETLALHGGPHRLRHGQHAGHVELQDLAELGRVHLHQRPVQAGAGVVHQPVDPLVPVEGGGQQVSNLRWVGHVGGHGQRPAEFLAQRGQPVGAARGQHRMGPSGVQQARGGRADTGGRAGDDHRLAGQINEIRHAPRYTGRRR
jgi:hypothetical protein